MIKINNKKIGKNNPCFIVFEIGPTHNGFKSAKKLIKQAKVAGADAVKFQMINADRLVEDKKQLFEYKILIDKKRNKFKSIRESLYEILKRRELTKDQFKKLKKYCDKIGICFFSTASFDDEIDFLKSIGCDTVKIASADVNHFPLLKKAAQSKMCVQIDTGMATIDEISLAKKQINRYSKKLIIHHCPPGYPSRHKDVNLNILKTLQKKFDCPVAFSDHTPGYNVDIAALAFGANLLEKTITENKMTKSVEHSMSLEFDEMCDFVKSIREIEQSFGIFSKKLNNKEIQNRKKIRRSIFLSQNVKKGQKLKNIKVEFRRPGTGISVELYESFKNKIFKKDLLKGYKIKSSDLN